MRTKRRRWFPGLLLVLFAFWAGGQTAQAFPAAMSKTDNEKPYNKETFVPEDTLKPTSVEEAVPERPDPRMEGFESTVDDAGRGKTPRGIGKPEKEEEEGKVEALSPEERPGRRGKSLSRIERILSGEFPKEISRELRQFGYDFFDKDISTFAPVTNVPVGDDYVVGPGDRFVVHLWGNVEMTHEGVISRDGGITLPRLGTMTVSGMTYAEMKRYLHSRYNEYYPDFEMSVTMGSLRTLEVFVIGEAKNPGTYSVSSLSSIITALHAAGGPAKSGSLRDIRLYRSGEMVKSLDLYRFLVLGNKSGDLRLQPADTIFIPVIGQVVGIAGNVRRPAIYEMKGEQTIGDIISLAGGVLPTGRLQNVVVERIEAHQRRIVRSFNLEDVREKADENLQTLLRDGDVLKIYPVHDTVQEVVHLQGHVKYPTEYELRPGMRLRDILPTYEILLPEAYLPRAEILRLMPPDDHPEIVPFDLGKLLAGDESSNLLLQDMDRVVVYAAAEKMDLPVVHIKGEVRKPGTYRLLPGMTIKDLIFRAGNLTQKAYQEKATVTRVLPTQNTADIVKLEVSLEGILAQRPGENLVLKNNDEVHIREIPNYAEALRRRVTLEGEFLFPGEYSFSEGERLASVIERAGGLTREAYLYGATFMRESAKEVQRARLKEYIDKLEQDILTSSTQEAELASDQEQGAAFEQSLAAKRQLLEKLKEARPTGRMVLDLGEVILLPNSKYNLELKPGDRLVVGKRPDHVNVLGEVFNATAIFAEADKTVGYYLDRVGGTTREADESQIYVVQANGSVVSKSQSGFFGVAGWDSENNRWALGGFNSLRPHPGDTIIVPRETEKYRWWTLTKDVVDIMYKIAVAAGVIIVAY